MSRIPLVLLLITLAPTAARADDGYRIRGVLEGGVAWTPGATPPREEVEPVGDLSLELQYAPIDCGENRFALELQLGGSALSEQTVVRTIVGASWTHLPRGTCDAPDAGDGYPMILVRLGVGPFVFEDRAESPRWSWGLAIQPSIDLLWSADDAVFGGFRVMPTTYLDFDRDRPDVRVHVLFGFLFGAHL